MRIRVPGAIAAAICVVTLSACGGGSGDGTTVGTEMSLQEKYRSFAAGNPTFEMSESESVDLVNGVERLRTHSTYGADYSFDPGTGTWSRDADPFSSETDDFLPGEIIDALPDGVIVSPILEHDGVKLFKVEVDATYAAEIEGGAPTRVISENWYGYLQFGSFWVDKNLSCYGPSTSSCDESSLGELSSLEIWSGSSGRFSGDNPTGTGSAAWTGVMTGVDVRQSRPGSTLRVLGDARIDIDDLSDPDVDVAFTGIRELASGTARTDMTWTDLALTNGGFSDGNFSISDGSISVPPLPSDGSPPPSAPPTPPETIRGMFYGSAHQEVGGVFDRDGITGAFGAKRR